MDQNRKGVCRNRSTTEQFLVCKTDSRPEESAFRGAPFIGLDELKKSFPDMLSGETFIDFAMKALESDPCFCVMAVQIDWIPIQDQGETRDNLPDRDDRSDNNRTAPSEEPPIDTVIEVAKAIEAVSKSESGIWGWVDHDLLMIYFNQLQEIECLQLAAGIHTHLAENLNHKVTIGVASYPTLNFSRHRIAENARKAIDHAAFYGLGSTVAFDAISLNISADQLYQEGDIDGAIAEFSAGLQLDPSNVNIHNSLGVCYGVSGDYEKAIESFETAVWLDPGEVMAIYNLGLVYLLIQDREKALERFLEADEAGEDVFEVVFEAGKLYLEMEDPQTGEVFLDRAVRLRPDSWAAFRYLGQCCASLGRTEEAVSAYKKAVKLNPNDAHSLSSLGYLFELQEENAEIATLFCKKSIEISPENGLFRHRLARLFFKQDRLEEALKEFIEATKLGHDSVEFIEQIQDRLENAKESTG